MTDVKFLRRFNLIVFSLLFVMGVIVFFFFFERLEGYLEFADVISKILIILVVAGAAGSPIKKLIENKKNGENKENPTQGQVD